MASTEEASAAATTAELHQGYGLTQILLVHCLFPPGF